MRGQIYPGAANGPRCSAPNQFDKGIEIAGGCLPCSASLVPCSRTTGLRHDCAGLVDVVMSMTSVTSVMSVTRMSPVLRTEYQLTTRRRLDRLMAGQGRGMCSCLVPVWCARVLTGQGGSLAAVVWRPRGSEPDCAPRRTLPLLKCTLVPSLANWLHLQCLPVVTRKWSRNRQKTTNRYSPPKFFKLQL